MVPSTAEHVIGLQLISMVMTAVVRIRADQVADENRVGGSWRVALAKTAGDRFIADVLGAIKTGGREHGHGPEFADVLKSSFCSISAPLRGMFFENLVDSVF